jgi:hypothetical protein
MQASRHSTREVGTKVLIRFQAGSQSVVEVRTQKNLFFRGGFVADKRFIEGAQHEKFYCGLTAVVLAHSDQTAAHNRNDFFLM